MNLNHRIRFSEASKIIPYSVSTKTTSQWSGHANIEFVFENTGSVTIHETSTLTGVQASAEQLCLQTIQTHSNDALDVLETDFEGTIEAPVTPMTTLPIFLLRQLFLFL